jgi:hypothetical protein
MSRRRINLAVFAILGVCTVLGLIVASSNSFAQLAVLALGSAVGLDALHATK